MAKRGADDQITKDNASDHEQESDEPGVRQVPLAPVTGRKIRGLPKRAGASAAPVPQSAPTPALSGFSFGQPAAAPSSSPFSFGSTAAAAAPTSSGFTFGAASSAPATKPSPFSQFSFGAPPAPAPAPAPPAQVSVPASSIPAQSTVGSTATSFSNNAINKLSPSKEKPVSLPEPIAPSPPADKQTLEESSSAQTEDAPAVPVPSLSTPPPKGEVDYHTVVLGLNTSLLQYVTHLVDKDRFTNLAEILPGLVEQYEKYLDAEADKIGWRPARESASAPAAAPKAPATSSTPFSFSKPPATSQPPSLPAPPTVGSFSLLPTPTSSSSTPTGTGFVPSVPSSTSGTSSPFTFGVGGASKGPSKSVSRLVEDIVSGKADCPEDKQSETETPSSKPFTFNAGATPSSASTPAKSTSGSGLFQFAPSGPIHPTTPDSKSFSPSANVQSASSWTPSAPLGKFGPGGANPQLSFGGATGTSPSSSAASTAGAAGFNFAKWSSSTGKDGFSIGAGPSAPKFSVGENASEQKKDAPEAKEEATGAEGEDKSADAYKFGSPETTKTAFTFESKAAQPTFSFGASSTSSTSSAPKPSAFSFGVTPSATPTFSFGATSTPSGPAVPSPFGSTSSAPVTFSSSFGKGTPAAATESEDANNDKPAEAAATGDVAPGSPSKNRGELAGEGEEGEDTLQTNRAKLFKLEGGKYENVGLGTVKLKKETGGDKRRLLMRTDGNGNIILNMAVTKRLNPSAEGTSIKFLGFDLEGKPAGYLLRVKNAQMASEFVDAVKDEVAALPE